MTTKAEQRLAELDVERAKVAAKVTKERSRKTIRCVCCKKLHRIRDLEFVQTHHYVEPHGCTGGDYWTQSEGRFVCPDSNIENRLYFAINQKVPWDKRDDFKHNAEEQFLRTYRPLFKSHSDRHDRRQPESVLNRYVDNNHKKFGIVLAGENT